MHAMPVLLADPDLDRAVHLGLLRKTAQRDVQDAQPAFTWSDAACDGFESGSQSVPCG